MGGRDVSRVPEGAVALRPTKHGILSSRGKTSRHATPLAPQVPEEKLADMLLLSHLLPPGHQIQERSRSSPMPGSSPPRCPPRSTPSGRAPRLTFPPRTAAPSLPARPTTPTPTPTPALALPPSLHLPGPSGARPSPARNGLGACGSGRRRAGKASAAWPGKATGRRGAARCVRGGEAG